MNGNVIPGTPIAVDIWRRPHIEKASVFFLSHAHSDHTAGLTSTWRDVIYTSPVTAKIIINKIKVHPHLVKALEVGESHRVPIHVDGKEAITVTLIDANHCPGSVMFIFQGYFGTVLYTGDFRYMHDMPRQISEICTAGIEMAFIDNTYCDPVCEFPSRELATLKVLEIIQDHDGAQIIIELPNLGKEELLISIATTIRSWIVVDEERMKTLSLLELQNVFSTDCNAGRIHVVPTRSITRNNLQKWAEKHYQPVIAILPTALYSGMPQSNFFARSPNVYVVPYSDHSSFSELQEFVSKVRPRKVIPIIKSNARGPMGLNISHRANMTVFNNSLDSSAPVAISDPLLLRQLLKSKLPTSPSRLKIAPKRRKAVILLARGLDYESDGSEQEEKENELKLRSDMLKQTGLKNAAPLSPSSKNNIKVVKSTDGVKKSGNLLKLPILDLNCYEVLTTSTEESVDCHVGDTQDSGAHVIEQEESPRRLQAKYIASINSKFSSIVSKGIKISGKDNVSCSHPEEGICTNDCKSNSSLDTISKLCGFDFSWNNRVNEDLNPHNVQYGVGIFESKSVENCSLNLAQSGEMDLKQDANELQLSDFMEFIRENNGVGNFNTNINKSHTMEISDESNQCYDLPEITMTNVSNCKMLPGDELIKKIDHFNQHESLSFELVKTQLLVKMRQKTDYERRTSLEEIFQKYSYL